MYRVHNTTNSPFQIDTAKGTTIVPAQGSAIADLTEDQRMFIDGYPDYRVEPVSYDKPPVVNQPVSERDQIITELNRLGVDFDGRMGVKKLRKLLDGANR